MHTDISLTTVKRSFTDFALKMSQVQIRCDPWQIGHGKCVAVNVFLRGQPIRKDLRRFGDRFAGVATDVVMAQFTFCSRKSNK